MGRLTFHVQLGGRKRKKKGKRQRQISRSFPLAVCRGRPQAGACGFLVAAAVVTMGSSAFG